MIHTAQIRSQTVYSKDKKKHGNQFFNTITETEEQINSQLPQIKQHTAEEVSSYIPE